MFRHELWSTGRTPPSHLAAANQPRNHWALWTFVVAGDLGSTYWLNAPRRGDDDDDGGGSMVSSSFNSSAILSSPLLSSFVVYPAQLYSDLRSTGVSLRTYLVPNSASYVLMCPFVTTTFAAATHNRASPSFPVQRVENERNTLYFSAVASSADADRHKDHEFTTISFNDFMFEILTVSIEYACLLKKSNISMVLQTTLVSGRMR